MEIDKIIELIQAVSTSELTEFKLEDGCFKLYMETAKRKPSVIMGESSNTAMQMSGSAAANMQVQETAVSCAPPLQSNAETVGNTVEVSAGNVVKSPLVGTFYRASSPDNPPYVQVGDSVKKGQVLGIVEAMKLMNEIESEFDGVVKEIRVENEQMVEYGQPLFVIE